MRAGGPNTPGKTLSAYFSPCETCREVKRPYGMNWNDFVIEIRAAGTNFCGRDALPVLFFPGFLLNYTTKGIIIFQKG